MDRSKTSKVVAEFDSLVDSVMKENKPHQQRARRSSEPTIDLVDSSNDKWTSYNSIEQDDFLAWLQQDVEISAEMSKPQNLGIQNQEVHEESSELSAVSKIVNLSTNQQTVDEHLLVALSAELDENETAVSLHIRIALF